MILGTNNLGICKILLTPTGPDPVQDNIGL